MSFVAAKIQQNCTGTGNYNSKATRQGIIYGYRVTAATFRILDFFFDFEETNHEPIYIRSAKQTTGAKSLLS